ncbi:MAG: glycosyl hydrolase family 18 protein [Burkholderiaceae bacterium]
MGTSILVTVCRQSLPVIVAGLAAGNANAQPGSPAGPQVMGWVPAYGIDASMKVLGASPAIGQAMTRIGLQFWNPSNDGRGVVLAPVDATGKPVTAASVRQVAQWARAHNVQPLLTVYNNSQVINRWDWQWARRAFAEHPDEFAAALVAAVDKWDLDGVDLDLEGEGDFTADRAAYGAFVHQLSAALKSKGKLLTVDSFHSPCDNAPNMRWWSDWVGDVATIHSMGYEDLYEGSNATFTPEGRPVCENGATLFRYSWQLDWAMKAGYRRDQIVMGMPTWVDTWGSGGIGPGVVDHLREVRALGGGVGLWDMQLAAAGWNKPATWEAVQSLRRPANALARRPSLLDRLFHRGSGGGGAGSEAVNVTERGNSASRFRAAPTPTR